MSDERKPDDRVVKLVDAGVPADHGLSSLGMLMQLGGTVLAAYAAIVLFSSLGDVRGDGETLWIFLALGLSIARSLMHRAAGTILLYGTGTLDEGGKAERFVGIKRYIVFAVAQSLAIGALLAKLHAPVKVAGGVTAALALWPMMLLVLFQLPRFKRYRDELPLTEDKGFEGASILMTVAGACGTVAMGTLLLFLFDLPGRALMQGPGVMMLLAVGMLVVRSLFHVQAGISGLRETNVDRSVELANRYANFGVISSFCAAGALLMIVFSWMNVIGVALICGVAWMLMAWPLIIRRFFSDRQFADLLAGDEAPIHRRAPDAGLTGLGWLLFAHAIYSAVFVIIAFATIEHHVDAVSAMTSIGGTITQQYSLWFRVGIIVLQAWAGFELIRMSPQSRAIATLCGVVTAGVLLYINWPMIKVIKVAGPSILGSSHMIEVAPIAIALIIPIITIILVNRQIAPSARARFRSKPA